MLTLRWDRWHCLGRISRLDFRWVQIRLCCRKECDLIASMTIASIVPLTSGSYTDLDCILKALSVSSWCSLLGWASWAWHEIRVFLDVVVLHWEHFKVFHSLWLGAISVWAGCHWFSLHSLDLGFEFGNLLIFCAAFLSFAYKYLQVSSMKFVVCADVSLFHLAYCLLEVLLTTCSFVSEEAPVLGPHVCTLEFIGDVWAPVLILGYNTKFILPSIENLLGSFVILGHLNFF